MGIIFKFSKYLNVSKFSKCFIKQGNRRASQTCRAWVPSTGQPQVAAATAGIVRQVSLDLVPLLRMDAKNVMLIEADTKAGKEVCRTPLSLKDKLGPGAFVLEAY